MLGAGGVVARTLHPADWRDYALSASIHALLAVGGVAVAYVTRGALETGAVAVFVALSASYFVRRACVILSGGGGRVARVDRLLMATVTLVQRMFLLLLILRAV